MTFVAYRRVPSAGACEFCLVVATNGAFYHSEDSAGASSDYHDNCRCDVEAETEFDRRTDIAIKPEDARRIVSIRRGTRTHTYDLQQFAGRIRQPPKPKPPTPKATVPKPRPKPKPELAKTIEQMDVDEAVAHLRRRREAGDRLGVPRGPDDLSSLQRAVDEATDELDRAIHAVNETMEQLRKAAGNKPWSPTPELVLRQQSARSAKNRLTKAKARLTKAKKAPDRVDDAQLSRDLDELQAVGRKLRDVARKEQLGYDDDAARLEGALNTIRRHLDDPDAKPGPMKFKDPEISKFDQQEVVLAMERYPTRVQQMIHDLHKGWHWIKTSRGYNSSLERTISIGSRNTKSTSIHEVMHTLETQGLVGIERRWWQRRVGKSGLAYTDSAWAPSAPVRKTKKWYTLKTYAADPKKAKNFEVLTTGIQDLLTGRRDYLDDDLEDLVWGVLAWLS